MRGPPAVIAAVALGAAALPALAAGDRTTTARGMDELAPAAVTVTAQGTNEFEPASVTIAVGQTVTLANAGGTHNFRFADEALPSSPTAANDPVWPLTKTFSAAGRYGFVCDAHGPQMAGVVTVVAPTPTATPTPTPTPDPGGGGGPGPGAPALTIRALRIRGGPFCSRRSRVCRRPGVALRIDLSAPARVRGNLRRRGRRAGSIHLGTVPAGPRTVRFGRRLKRGRYTLRLRAGDLALRVLRFRIRR